MSHSLKTNLYCCSPTKPESNILYGLRNAGSKTFTDDTSWCLSLLMCSLGLVLLQVSQEKHLPRTSAVQDHPQGFWWNVAGNWMGRKSLPDTGAYQGMNG